MQNITYQLLYTHKSLLFSGRNQSQAIYVRLIMLLILILLLGTNLSAAIGDKAIDSRCQDLPASEASALPPTRCKVAHTGYSWHPKAEDCIVAVNASCAKTRNKFKQKEKCLECKS